MKTLYVIVVGLFLSLTTKAQTFTLKSSDLQGQATHKQVYNGFGCTGSNISPQLSWENAPQGTKSFAIVMYDPDAPTGRGWIHWTVFDIPAGTKELKSGSGDTSKTTLPKEIIQGIADYGTYGYGGPCPPEGDKPHKYEITVFALKTEKLGLDKNANPSLVGFYINANMLAKATLTAYYQR
ncbi:YbhB/YbcL family Raf kinase inhibitor-like protein [Flavobacterium cerinum]|uniref:YbhB/YbcL family Raf kinase inhibitor-like protein n=1 Tax=Flavobacterium cerinum TaxID=2502784 RepID=A0ABY5IY95_9FLAO|nr:YbhB/YbcL family Raf kinase inhibitor-like protein [Flavobacterium cerinum]UUC46457.1 YbhB/YbcL family Raf kinase inhibitor-like protein [Flavobacterium cerinum]